jgi:hypothetical protein
VTTFDWTQPHVRALWVEQVMNITETGLVDGIFADHSAEIGVSIGGNLDKQGPNQLCNGNGAVRVFCAKVLSRDLKSKCVHRVCELNKTKTLRGFLAGFCTRGCYIGSHACSLEASKRVTNSIPLGGPLSYRLTLSITSKR